MDMNCAYCAKGELVAKFGYEVCELPASTVYLFKEQSHPGRVIVASKHHVSEMLELSLEDRTAFIEDVVTTANAIHKVFHPDKVNTECMGTQVTTFTCTWCPNIKMNSSGAEPSRWILILRNWTKRSARKSPRSFAQRLGKPETLHFGDSIERY